MVMMEGRRYSFHVKLEWVILLGGYEFFSVKYVLFLGTQELLYKCQNCFLPESIYHKARKLFNHI